MISEINNNIVKLKNSNIKIIEYLYCKDLIDYKIIEQQNIQLTPKIKHHAFKNKKINFEKLNHETDLTYDFLFDIINKNLLSKDDFLTINISSLKICDCQSYCDCENDELIEIIKKYKLLDLFFIALEKFQDLSIIQHHYMHCDFYYDAILNYIVDKTVLLYPAQCNSDCRRGDFHYHSESKRGNHAWGTFLYFIEGQHANPLVYSQTIKNKFFAHSNNYRYIYDEKYSNICKILNETNKLIYDYAYTDIYNDMLETIIMIISLKNKKKYQFISSIKYSDKFFDSYMKEININSICPGININPAIDREINIGIICTETKNILWNFLENNKKDWYFEKLLSIGIQHNEIKKITNNFSAKYYGILLEQNKVKFSEIPTNMHDSLLQLPQINNLIKYFPDDWYEYDITTNHGEIFAHAYFNYGIYIYDGLCKNKKINNLPSVLCFIQKSDKRIKLLNIIMDGFHAHDFYKSLNAKTKKGTEMLEELITKGKFNNYCDKTLYDYICSAYNPYGLFDTIIEKNIMKKDFYDYDPNTDLGYCFLKKNIISKKYSITNNLINFIEKSKDPIEIFSIGLKNNYIGKWHVKDKYYIKMNYENFNNCSQCNIFGDNKNIIVPCGHGFLCNNCADKLNTKCFKCQKDFTIITKINV